MGRNRYVYIETLKDGTAGWSPPNGGLVVESFEKKSGFSQMYGVFTYIYSL